MDPARPRSVVGWTVVLGLVVGLVAATYFSIAGEPAIDDAIAIEEAHATHNDGHEDEQVSRSVQRGPGLFVAYAAFGGAFGLLLAVTALALRGPWLDPFRRFAVAGAVLTGAVAVAPWLKYPPNPPAVGDEGTVGERQLGYWLLIVAIGIVLVGAAHLSARLRGRGWEDADRIAVVSIAAVAAAGLVLAVFPANSVGIPPEVPASLIWRFRTASLIGNLLLWGLLTVAAGALYAAATRRAWPVDDRTPPSAVANAGQD